MIAGFGNDGESAATRAAAPAASIGTYLHGPLLPRNPWLADWLLADALAHATGGDVELEPLADELEAEAHAVSAERARVARRALLGNPERAEVDGRVAGLPALQEALDRRVHDDLVQLVEREEPVPRTAASCDRDLPRASCPGGRRRR